MSKLIDCTGPRFRGLVNPYTGEPVGVKMLVTKTGEPLFAAPDTYSTAQAFPTRAEAVAAWNRKNGVSGLKDGEPLTCAYTGRPLRPASDGARAWLEGGFDPRVFRPRDEFLHYMRMRGGKSTGPAPSPASRVTLAQESAPMPVSDEVERTTEAEDIAARIVEQYAEGAGIEKKTFVSMAKGGRKRNGRVLPKH